MDKRFFDPHFVLLYDRHRLLDDQYGHIEGVSVHSIQYRKSVDPRRLSELIRLLRRLRPDLIHTVLPTANLWGLLAARWIGIRPCIGSLRGLRHSRLDRWYWVDRLALRYLADKVVVNSDAVKDNCIRVLGVKSDKIFRIYNGFRPHVLSNVDRTTFLRSLGIPWPDRPVLSVVGRLDANKSVGDILSAVRILHQSGMPVTLLVAGQGIQSQQLKNQVRRDGLEGLVFFLGFVSQIPLLLQSTDILITASQSEGFCNVIFEAMSLGIPVATTDIPTFRELIRPGQTGFVFRPRNPQSMADVLREMLSNPSRRRQVAQQAKKEVESRFSLATMVNAYQEWYQQLLANLPRKD
ncbi:MAG: glycosyltransferase family 4 protein [Phycisphaerae bacterium]|nr:glycosyltransferase family 4 protein [Phycisphaerae bacterium]